MKRLLIWKVLTKYMEKEIEGVSNCCGAKVAFQFNNTGKCCDCHENCSVENEEDED